uniref:Reticulophagy regulator 1 n=1 Tax=Oncorhynchus mykiss TaxID=8022 RepID=A0A8K9UJ13_ONCMY
MLLTAKLLAAHTLYMIQFSCWGANLPFTTVSRRGAHKTHMLLIQLCYVGLIHFYDCIIDAGQDSRSGAGLQVTDSWTSFKLFLQETSSFKQQNPGKFCLLVCSLCTFLAVLGRYIPGVLILYVLVLGVFLWPLMTAHDFGLWMKPVLQKLDFGLERFLQKIRENHVCKEMSISDTEASDVTWTDNGTFNLSEGHTPQTENSDDLDREELFIGGLPEFPSLDNGTNGEDDDDLSIGLPTPPSQPQHSRAKGGSVPPLQGDPSTQAMEFVHKMAGNVIAAAATAVIQERLEAESSSDSDVEEFELLDQSELEQLEGELGLGASAAVAAKEPKKSLSSSSGFFSKLLGRH